MDPSEIIEKEPEALWITILLGIFRVWLFIYDCLAVLPFAIFANPGRKLERSRRVKAAPLVDGDFGSPWRNVECGDSLCTALFEDAKRLDQLWDRTALMHAKLPCMGVREVVAVEQEKQRSGRVFEKLNLGDYHWLSYGEVDDRVRETASGLLSVGHITGENLVIFADTRAEWMVTALACFRLNAPVVTVYSTLGNDAIVHALKETDAVTIVSAQELLPKVVQILPSCPKIKRIVFYHSPYPNAPPVDYTKIQIPIYSISEIEEAGQKSDLNPSVAGSENDLAMIMYTSGTTGLPKGVMITHANIVASTTGQGAAIPELGSDDVYLAYLPLAHILEVGAEICCLIHGVSIGYSSALTMHDRASKIKRGSKGDCSILKPTLIAAVPAITDRIYKAVADEVSASPPLMQALFELMYERKRDKLEHGYDNPFLNRLVYKRIRAILGGRLRMMLSGGAPLSAETQRFMNICFCCPVGQGYGLTETCGAGTICDAEDLTTGRVGPPLICNDLLLRDWVEGNYTTKNKPYPQGEILLSGGNVVLGYWKLPDKTAEDFVELEGRRWFCTGDIGEIHEDGSLKIIDRKKDLIKLSHGEYISLGKVETTLLTDSLIENICVCGNSLQAYLVALVVPNRKNLTKLAQELSLDTDDFEALCSDPALKKAVYDKIVSHGKQSKLEKMEIPGKIHLCTEIWTPAMGLLTEAYKLKRKPIDDYYKTILEDLYKN